MRYSVRDFAWLKDDYITQQFNSFGKQKINQVDFLFLFAWGHVRELCLLLLGAVKMVLLFNWKLIKPVYYTLIWVVFLWSFFISGIIAAFIVVVLPHFSDEVKP